MYLIMHIIPKSFLKVIITSNRFFLDSHDLVTAGNQVSLLSSLALVSYKTLLNLNDLLFLNETFYWLQN